MQQELGALLAAMPDEAPVVLAGREFWLGHLDGQDVVVVLSRIGKVAAAMTATLLVHEFGAERAIFTGTAGGLHESARVGDVVVADALLQHDMDASPLFPRHEVPLYGTDRFAADASLRPRWPAPPATCSPPRPATTGDAGDRRSRSTAPRCAPSRSPRPRFASAWSSAATASWRARPRARRCAAASRRARGRDGGRRAGAGLPRSRRSLRRRAHDLGPRRQRGARRLRSLRRIDRQPLQRRHRAPLPARGGASAGP